MFNGFGGMESNNCIEYNFVNTKLIPRFENS